MKEYILLIFALRESVSMTADASCQITSRLLPLSGLGDTGKSSFLIPALIRHVHRYPSCRLRALRAALNANGC